MEDLRILTNEERNMEAVAEGLKESNSPCFPAEILTGDSGKLNVSSPFTR